ncbi:hypothetical protein ACFYST_28965 [Kitasatospora sp. NPDC004614]|uniref:hypothetical protein n=2 Tax=Kitasatospora TaxID=2063 RepID=UPI00369242FF
MTAGENGMPEVGGDQPVELGLAAAAEAVTIGPVPVDGILDGGRRIRRRRRTMLGALTLASVVALGGGTAAGLYGFGGNGSNAQAVQAAAGDCAGASAKPQADGRDPLKPQRQMVTEGTTEGKKWQVWKSHWPLAPKEKAYEQAVAIWQERHAADPSLEKPTEASVQKSWSSTDDIIDLYSTVDGARQKRDTLAGIPAPGKTAGQQTRSVQLSVFDGAGTPGVPQNTVTLSIVGPAPAKGDGCQPGQGASGAPQTGNSPADSQYQVNGVQTRPTEGVGDWRFAGQQSGTPTDSGQHG